MGVVLQMRPRSSNAPFHKPAGPSLVGYCSLCETDVPDLFGHHMLHFTQWDVELVVAFMAGVHPNDAHSRRLVHPLWKAKTDA